MVIEKKLIFDGLKQYLLLVYVKRKGEATKKGIKNFEVKKKGGQESWILSIKMFNCYHFLIKGSKGIS